MIPHTGQILTPSTSHKHNTVLLDIVALAGDIRPDDPVGRELDSCDFTVGRVGLLGGHDGDTEADAFEEGPVLNGG